MDTTGSNPEQQHGLDAYPVFDVNAAKLDYNKVFITYKGETFPIHRIENFNYYLSMHAKLDDQEALGKISLVHQAYLRQMLEWSLDAALDKLQLNHPELYDKAVSMVELSEELHAKVRNAEPGSPERQKAHQALAAFRESPEGEDYSRILSSKLFVAVAPYFQEYIERRDLQTPDNDRPLVPEDLLR